MCPIFEKAHKGRGYATCIANICFKQLASTIVSEPFLDLNDAGAAIANDILSAMTIL